MKGKSVLYACLVICLIIFSQLFSSTSIAATVISYNGTVKVVKYGNPTGYQCTPNMKLGKGDWINTAANANVRIAFDDDRQKITSVDENTLAVIGDGINEQIELFNGRLVTSLSGPKLSEAFIIKTPAGLCGAFGTGWAVSTTGRMTDIGVFDNRVFIKALNPDGTLMDEPVWVEEGFSRRTEKYHPPQEMVRLDDDEIEEFKTILKSAPIDNSVIFQLEGTKPVMGSLRKGEGKTGIIEINGVGINVNSQEYRDMMSKNKS